MVHGIRLRDGRAEWYRNRWVRTPALDGAPYMTETGPDLTASTAGTHVIEHAGRLLALCESNLPFELTPELETVGAYDFDGKLTNVMTAHPKHDPVTGELHFFSSSPFPPYLTYHVSSEKGDLIHSAEVPGATASLKHDFAVTERYVVFVEGTVTFDHTETSGIPYAWKDEHPARIGVMPRGQGGAAAIRWFDIEPGSMLHAANAYEDELGRIVLEGPTVRPGGLPDVLELVGGRSRTGSRAQLPFLQPAVDRRPRVGNRERAGRRRPGGGVPHHQRGPRRPLAPLPVRDLVPRRPGHRRLRHRQVRPHHRRAAGPARR
ncbi:hypothetical protein SFUMM280S_00172 [Streptomyces fumanus]